MWPKPPDAQIPALPLRMAEISGDAYTLEFYRPNHFPTHSLSPSPSLREGLRSEPRHWALALVPRALQSGEACFRRTKAPISVSLRLLHVLSARLWVSFFAQSGGDKIIPRANDVETGVPVLYLLASSQHCPHKRVTAWGIGFHRPWLESPRLESRAA